jgi:hypothetical protein
MSDMALEFEVHDAQRHILEAVQRFVVLVCGRRFGKDHLAAIKIIMHAFSFQSPRGAKLYAWLNPVYNPQGKESFRVFCEFARSANLLKHTINTPPMEAHLINGDRVTFFSADQPDNLRGGQYDGLIVNEAGFVTMLEQLWSGPLAAMLLDRDGWAWIMGTPNGKNDFHKFFLRGLTTTDGNGNPSQWKSFRFPTYANPFIKKESIDAFKIDMPEDMFRQEYLAEFLDSGGTVFKGLSAMRMRSQGLQLMPQSDGCRVGCDIGRYRDWTVLTALSPNHAVIGFDRYKDLPWDQSEARILNFMSRYRGRLVIDISNQGEGLAERIAAKGIPVDMVRYTNKVKQKQVTDLQLMIEDGLLKVPPPTSYNVDPSRDLAILWRELEAYTFEITTGGAFRYCAPPGQTDDCVTSLMLAGSVLPPMVTASLSNMPSFDDVREIGEASWE